MAWMWRSGKSQPCTLFSSPAAGNPHNSQLASIGSGTMLQMMLVDNLIHSDLHPGNILVRLEPPAGLLGGSLMMMLLAAGASLCLLQGVAACAHAFPMGARPRLGMGCLCSLLPGTCQAVLTRDQLTRLS